MVFCSLNFMFIFMPILLICYNIPCFKNIKIKNGILLIFSLFFYAYGGVAFLPVMLSSILINYLGALLIDISKKEKFRKLFLVITIILNISMLGYFKYTMFFLDNINAMFNTNIMINNIVLPIGISFFTFQGLSYVIDTYWNKVKCQRNPIIVALYISLFPQLIAGPIVTYQTVENELTNRKVDIDDIYEGIIKFCVGLGKKMIFANSMGEIAKDIFLKDPSSISMSIALLGAVTFALQIYFDFSGYSDMAIGLGRIFGFRFLENFNYPYIATSITDFWRRWHISLSRWFRDYVYIPLGGNRVSKFKHIRNILIVWIITGFWHGAAWNFIAWGLYFGIILIIEKLFLLKLLNKAGSIISHIYSIILILISWVIFNSPNMTFAYKYLGSMFSFKNGFICDEFINLININGIQICIAIIGIFPVVKIIKRYIEKINNDNIKKFILTFGVTGCALFIFSISLMKIVNCTFNPFIYFRF